MIRRTCDREGPVYPDHVPAQLSHVLSLETLKSHLRNDPQLEPYISGQLPIFCGQFAGRVPTLDKLLQERHELQMARTLAASNYDDDLEILVRDRNVRLRKLHDSVSPRLAPRCQYRRICLAGSFMHVPALYLGTRHPGREPFCVDNGSGSILKDLIATPARVLELARRFVAETQA